MYLEDLLLFIFSLIPYINEQCMHNKDSLLWVVSYICRYIYRVSLDIQSLVQEIPLQNVHVLMSRLSNLNLAHCNIGNCGLIII